MKFKTVLASREGLNGKITSAGLRIRPESIFVALPHVSALFKPIVVKIGDRIVITQVLDVGPWNLTDWDYVFGEDQPQSETGVDTNGRVTNKAGIDLSDGFIRELGMHPDEWGLREVQWSFIFESDILKLINL